MKNPEKQSPNAMQPSRIKRKAVSLSKERLVAHELMGAGATAVLITRPLIDGINLAAWAAANRDLIEAQLFENGAILFRDFNAKRTCDFEDFIKATSGEPLEYRERSSPRVQVSGNIYTSTDYPSHQSIFLHNENSYQHTWPLKIFFFCMVAPATGGRTPIADTRKVLKAISPETREKFMRKNVMYVRNFGDGIGLDWQTVFQTSDKAEVEDYCRAANIEFEWKSGNRLATRQVRHAVARHPRTGEMIWFNHAAFFNVSLLDPSIHEALLSQLKEEDLPNNTYYGDGSAIEPSVLAELRDAYQQQQTSFDWQEGDILMLDNMLTAHGREPFTGPRKIVVGMAEPLTLNDIQCIPPIPSDSNPRG
jgi:alpha-ketoglutarate-dependent taurine dioxygenase